MMFITQIENDLVPFVYGFTPCTVKQGNASPVNFNSCKSLIAFNLLPGYNYVVVNNSPLLYSKYVCCKNNIAAYGTT